MLVLEIIGLSVAFCATLFGVWSNPNRKTSTGTIATIIAIIGLAAGISLSVWRSRQTTHEATAAEQKRQDDLQTQLAEIPLNDLEIIWTFPKAPETIRQALVISGLLIDRNFLQNDDWYRMPIETKTKIGQAWHLETAIRPLLTCIAEGRQNLDKLYAGEKFADAIKRFNSDHDKWVDVGTDIDYIGPSYEILFPLNVKLNAALSLGKTEDDIVSTTRSIVDEEDPGLFELTNFAFKASADPHGEGFQIGWKYGSESLKRGVVRPVDIPINAGFPRHFSFVIVHRKVAQYEYLKIAKAFITPNGPEAQPRQKPWYYASKLEIIVNGLEGRKYTFDVKCAGDTQVNTDPGLYDHPELDYSYTRFDCILRKID